LKKCGEFSEKYSLHHIFRLYHVIRARKGKTLSHQNRNKVALICIIKYIIQRKKNVRVFFEITYSKMERVRLKKYNSASVKSLVFNWRLDVGSFSAKPIYI